ncbi:MAG: hypothetical protein V1761_02550 [bacterium]
MTKKIIFVIGYLLMAAASGFGLVANLVTLISGAEAGESVWTKPQMIVFVIAFVIIFAICVHMAIIWILRIITDRKIKQ